MKEKSTMLSMPENDRPYEKCLLFGPEKLQDEELLFQSSTRRLTSTRIFLTSQYLLIISCLLPKTVLQNSPILLKSEKYP